METSLASDGAPLALKETPARQCGGDTPKLSSRCEMALSGLVRTGGEEPARLSAFCTVRLPETTKLAVNSGARTHIAYGFPTAQGIAALIDEYGGMGDPRADDKSTAPARDAAAPQPFQGNVTDFFEPDG